MFVQDSTLVIDDSPDACRLMAILLGQLGEHARCIESGQEALDYLKTHIPRLILLDVVMSDMSGVDVLQSIRRDPRLAAVPVILLSGTPQEAGFDDYAKEQGANEFWVKSTMLFQNLKQLIAPYLTTATIFAPYIPTPIRTKHEDPKSPMN